MEKIHHKAWPTKTYHPIKNTPPPPPTHTQIFSREGRDFCKTMLKFNFKDSGNNTRL